MCHDYGRIFEIEGLYEKIFFEHLNCRSHESVAEALHQALADRGLDLEERTVLDLGAGNGHVGARLQALGARTLIGIDALREARDAAQRDHPGLYRRYLLTSADSETDLKELGIDTVICVAALGFGDVGPGFFERILSILAPGSLVAFNIKEQFLNCLDPTGFYQLFGRLQQQGRLQPLKHWRQFHRLSTWGEPIYYSGVVAEIC